MNDKPIQLSLFENDIIKSDFLICPDSPKKAYYKIWLEQKLDSYSVRKESGTEKKALDIREWPFSSFSSAKKYYNNKLDQKKSDKRKRKYISINDL